MGRKIRDDTTEPDGTEPLGCGQEILFAIRTAVQENEVTEDFSVRSELVTKLRDLLANQFTTSTQLGIGIR